MDYEHQQVKNTQTHTFWEMILRHNFCKLSAQIHNGTKIARKAEAGYCQKY